MTETSCVARLREIRDEIGRELERCSWEQWEKQMRERVSRQPGLAAMLARAVGPERLRHPVSPDS